MIVGRALGCDDGLPKGCEVGWLVGPAVDPIVGDIEGCDVG